MFHFIHILFILKLASSLTFKLNENKTGYQWHYTYTISALSQETLDPASSTVPRIEAVPSAAPVESSAELGAFIDGLVEDAEQSDIRRHHNMKRKSTTTPFTTKFERGTTNKHKRNSLRDNLKVHHKKRPISSLITADTAERNPYPIKQPKTQHIGRNGDHIYIYVNNTANEQGIDQTSPVIIYNNTHYVKYKGNVIPRDYAQLSDLWTQLQHSYSPKKFDETFGPWMDWHSPPELRADAWQIWNAPAKPIVSHKSFDLTSWLGDVWHKVKNFGAQQFSAAHPIADPKGVRAGDYVYSYVNRSINEKGQKVQKVILYNKTHYLLYTGNKVPTDYLGLCDLWAEQSNSKLFDDFFKPPWWMEWHRPPWWMEWHTPPPGLLSNDTWEIWNQPGMKQPTARNSFDITKWIGELWHRLKNDHIQISTWKEAVSEPKVKSPKITRIGDYVYSYVNNTVDDQGKKLQKVILYNKSHYLVYTGNKVPADYIGLCDLWAELGNAKLFDNFFKPPWWMEWHRPPWWMEWHTPPPGLLRNDTWEIWNQPGMKQPVARNSLGLGKWLRRLWNTVINNHTDMSFAVPKMWLQHTKQQDRFHYRATSPLQVNRHRIKDDKHIKSFNKHILNSTLILFENVKSRTTEKAWRRRVKGLAEIYESAYKEYLRSIKDQEINSDVDARKTILNAIDTSNDIVKKLVNSMVDDINKRSVLNNSTTPGIFQTEMFKQLKRLLASACAKFGVCKFVDSFTRFLLDFTHSILKLDNNKFKQAIDAFVESVKNTAFYKHYLNSEHYIGANEMYNMIIKQPGYLLKVVVTIIRNIIDNINSPLTVEARSNTADGSVRGTLIFQDIINTLEEEVPNTANNIEQWNAMRRDMNAWLRNRPPHIKTTMSKFTNHLNDCARSLDKQSFNLVLSNVKEILDIFNK